jgi:hypothetical protein
MDQSTRLLLSAMFGIGATLSLLLVMVGTDVPIKTLGLVLEVVNLVFLWNTLKDLH